MAHSTSIPVAQQTPEAQFDWYTFLRNAFINGLKAYGSSLMVAAPEPGAGAPEPALSLSRNPSHLGSGETIKNPPTPAIPAPQITKPQPSPTLPHSTLVNPALNEAWTRA